MAKQYKRKYELILQGEERSKVITDLRIVFEISKSLRGFPNLAKIDIYNPNNDTISLINDDDPIIILKAGYEGATGLIFKGRLRNAFTNRISENRVITLYAGDGQREWESAIINKTYSENFKLKELVVDVLSTFLESGELSFGTLQDMDNREANKITGLTLSGSTKDVMDKLASDYNLVWSIQDNEIVVTDEDRSIDSTEAVLVNQTTGMIGSPTLTEIGADVTTLLNPDLLPNVAFKIESVSTNVALPGLQFRTLPRTTAEGLYRAFEVVFSGDTHGNNWYSTARGTVLNNA